MPITEELLDSEFKKNPASFLERLSKKSVMQIEFDFTKIISNNLEEFNDNLIDVTLHEMSDILKNICSKNKGVFNLVIQDLRVRYNNRIVTKCFRTPLHWLKDYLGGLDKRGRSSKQFSEEILNTITDDKNNYDLIDACLREKSPLEYLRSFLVYIRKKIPEFYEKIIQMIKKKDYKPTLIKRCLTSPPIFLIKFLEYLDYFEPEFSNELKIELLKDNNKKLIRQKVLNFDLGSFRYFLKYWKNQEIGKEFYDDLKKIRFSEEKIPKLINKILSSEFPRVQEIIEYMEKDDLPYEKVIEILIKNHINDLNKNALNSHLDHLVGFLKYLDKKDELSKELSRKIRTNLFIKENTPRLIDITLTSNFNEIAYFLGYLDKIDIKSKEFSDELINQIKQEKNINKLLRKTIKILTTNKKLRYWKGDLNTPFSNLKPFLSYIYKRDKDLFQFYITEISKKEYAPYIINHSLNIKVDKLQDFLNFLDNLDKITEELSYDIKRQFFEQQNIRRLINNCFKLPINYSTSLLKYFDKKIPRLSSSIIRAMMRDKNYNDFLFTLTTRSMPYQLIAFLQYLDSKIERSSNKIIRDVFSSKFKKNFVESYLKANLDQRRKFYRFLRVNYPPYLKMLDYEILNRKSE